MIDQLESVLKLLRLHSKITVEAHSKYCCSGTCCCLCIDRNPNILEKEEYESLLNDNEYLEKRLSPINEVPEEEFSDQYELDGWHNIPSLFIRCLIESPYWADRIKQQAIEWEFHHFKGPKWQVSDYTDAAALVSAAVVKEQHGKH